ncbi:MAG: RluA family pseudouridine synthase [Caldilineaceae bacterium]|nr:RluA family pseudouridine synthase [Caldilineaceae bacterium]
MKQGKSSKPKARSADRTGRTRRASPQRGHAITASDLSKPTRLDRYLRDRFPAWGRSAVQSTITAGHVFVNGRKVWLGSWQIHNGDRIEVPSPPPDKTPGPTKFDRRWLIAEDDHLIAVNKPAGLLSHTTRWREAANLLDLVQASFGDVALFHRLDRDTSGLILFSRSAAANRYLDRAFRERTVEKQYVALVRTPNRLAEEGEIVARIGPHPSRRDMQSVVEKGGKQAVTRYKVQAERDGIQQVYLWPQTGRTHQLRVHLASAAAPILGDRLYGPKPEEEERLMLHAWQITLPATAGFSERHFTAPLPDGFEW